jgi:hypothetical protein
MDGCTAMSAERDRRIERLCCLKVMGWHEWRTWETNDYDGPFPMFCAADATPIAMYDGETDDVTSYFSPLSETVDALALLEAHPGWAVDVRRVRGLWTAEIATPDGGRAHEFNHVSLCRALAYAALHAAGAGAELDALLEER